MPTANDTDVLDVEFRERLAAARPCRPPRPKGRRLGLQHLAFFRGYLEELDLTELADQYLTFGHDVCKAAPTRTWPGRSLPSSPRPANAGTLRPPDCWRSGRPPSPQRLRPTLRLWPCRRWRTSPPSTIRTVSIPGKSCSTCSPPGMPARNPTPARPCVGSRSTPACARGR